MMFCDQTLNTVPAAGIRSLLACGAFRMDRGWSWESYYEDARGYRDRKKIVRRRSEISDVIHGKGIGK